MEYFPANSQKRKKYSNRMTSISVHHDFPFIYNERIRIQDENSFDFMRVLEITAKKALKFVNI